MILLPENNKCLCGRTLPLLGRPLGRNDEILVYKGRKLNFQYFFHYFKEYLYINRYKVVQAKNGDIEFRIHLFHDTEENRKRCVSDLTLAFGEHISPLRVKFIKEFPIRTSGKFKVIEKAS